MASSSTPPSARRSKRVNRPDFIPTDMPTDFFRTRLGDELRGNINPNYIPTHVPGYYLSAGALPGTHFPAPFVSNYANIEGRKKEVMKFCSRSLLNRLGWYGRVKEMMSQAGWSAFCAFKEPTYPDLQSEFLATFSRRIADEGEVHAVDQPDVWRFRLLNRWFEVDEMEICQWMGFAYVSEEQGRPVNVKSWKLSFWEEISGIVSPHGVWDKNMARGFRIRDPKLRYIHRVLVNTVHACGTSNCPVNEPDLFMLYQIKRGIQARWARKLADRFEKLQRVKEKQSVRIGAWVTRIAKKLGILQYMGASVDMIEGVDATGEVAYSLLDWSSLVWGKHTRKVDGVEIIVDDRTAREKREDGDFVEDEEMPDYDAEFVNHEEEVHEQAGAQYDAQDEGFGEDATHPDFEDPTFGADDFTGGSSGSLEATMATMMQRMDLGFHHLDMRMTRESDRFHQRAGFLEQRVAEMEHHQRLYLQSVGYTGYQDHPFDWQQHPWYVPPPPPDSPQQPPPPPDYQGGFPPSSPQ